MKTLQGMSSLLETKTHSYDFFFNRMDYCLRKGKGFSVFHADSTCLTDFSEACRRKGYHPFTVQLSAIEEALSSIPASPQFVVIIQDLPYFEFLDHASLIADKLVFPL